VLLAKLPGQDALRDFLVELVPFITRFQIADEELFTRDKLRGMTAGLPQRRGLGRFLSKKAVSGS
jgi:hypothetical protein